jgi:hypothetical protein
MCSGAMLVGPRSNSIPPRHPLSDKKEQSHIAIVRATKKAAEYLRSFFAASDYVWEFFLGMTTAYPGGQAVERQRPNKAVQLVCSNMNSYLLGRRGGLGQLCG